MAASAKEGVGGGSGRRGREASLINNLLLPQASEKGRLHHGEKGRSGGEAALAPTAQATAPVPVSSKPELGKAYRVILLSCRPPGPGKLPLRGQARSLAAQPVGGWVGGGYFCPD